MYLLVKFSVLLATLCSFILNCFSVNLTKMVQPSPSGKMSLLRKATPSVFAKSGSNYTSHFAQIINNNTRERRLLEKSTSIVNFLRETSSFWTQTSCTSAVKMQRTKVKSVTSSKSITSFPIGDFKNGNHLDSIAVNVSQLNLNSTPAKKGRNSIDTKANCSQRKNCQRYGARWLKFYIEIGGWIMLAVVLGGITALVVTHILGRRQTNSNDFTSVRSKDLRYKGSWI